MGNKEASGPSGWIEHKGIFPPVMVVMVDFVIRVATISTMMKNGML